MPFTAHEVDFSGLSQQIKQWGGQLGFQQIGICDTDLGEHETRLLNWLRRGWHGEMDYMARHGAKRYRPAELVRGTIRIVSLRMDYFPRGGYDPEALLAEPSHGYISRYALGRDYHKVIRNKLQRLAEQIEGVVGSFGYRAFVDTAPVLEKAIAAKAGLGWIGKHTNLLSRESGSWFFLGELYTNLPLVTDDPVEEHCGTCRACIDICPTQAIVGPYQLDARRCISYLTIELRGSMPEELRPLVGNRIFGCDDCQLVCPWNRFAQASEEKDFAVRDDLDALALTTLFAWTEDEFLKRTEGSAIRRIGYECWLRNIAVALGNAPDSVEVVASLRRRLDDPSALVREHVRWALDRHAESTKS